VDKTTEINDELERAVLVGAGARRVGSDPLEISD
jgi:hypothetical protein